MRSIGLRWQSFRVPVNASSYGQADRKYEKASGYKRDKKAESQTGREHRSEGQEGKSYFDTTAKGGIQYDIS